MTKSFNQTYLRTIIHVPLTFKLFFVIESPILKSSPISPLNIAKKSSGLFEFFSDSSPGPKSSSNLLRF